MDLIKIEILAWPIVTNCVTLTLNYSVMKHFKMLNTKSIPTMGTVLVSFCDCTGFLLSFGSFARRVLAPRTFHSLCPLLSGLLLFEQRKMIYPSLQQTFWVQKNLRTVWTKSPFAMITSNIACWCAYT